MNPSRAPAILLLAALAGAAAGQPPPTIVRIRLGPEADERQPVTLPTEPGNTVEIDFPWPLEDWAGRGFSPDPEKFAGDFVIEASRGNPRLFVTPVAEGAHRVLHVVLAQPGGETRSLPLEFIPAPPGLAWRKVVFGPPGPAADPAPSVLLAPVAPKAAIREASPDSEIGLLRTLRLMLNTTAAGAQAIAAANPALELQRGDGAPRSLGDFTIANRFAVRDAVTDTVGLCVSVSNATDRRLLFEPGSWVVRVGSRVYPVRTVSFANELEPGASAPAFLLLTRGPNGEPTRLLPGNAFQVSVLPLAAVNPRAVQRLPLAGFGTDE
jgi:hypothetical protein